MNAVQIIDREEELEFSDVDELQKKYLTFWINDQLFGMPIADVIQIVRMQKITPIPDYPRYAKGVINLRGEIIPVIDLRIRFGKPEADYDDHTCIIIATIEGTSFGFAVDEVAEVLEIPDEQFSDPPLIANNDANRYLIGLGTVNEKIILVINTSLVLSDEEFHVLRDTAD